MRLTTCWVALCAALLCPAAALAAAPEDDPFYGVPAGVEQRANGEVIDAREVTATQFSWPIDAKAWQIRFRSEDTTGRATAYIATVLVPRTAWSGPGPRPVLSYQMPEDGVGLKCAPSWVLTQGLTAPTNTTPDAHTVASAVERGWTVVVPDYQGPDSAWLGADGQARGVLDAVRAARAFRPAGIAADAPVGLWGYSGGAIASSTAAQLQPSYAPELTLAGVALGGNNASIRGGLQAFDGSVFGGAIVIGLIGLDRAYPEYHLTDHLNAFGQAAVAQSQDDCIADAAIKHPMFRAADGLSDPTVLDRAPFTEVFRRASPLTYPGVPAAPVYDYHATGDELAPIGPNRQLIERFCRAGVTVQSVEEFGEHFTEVAQGEAGAVAFLTARFAGRTPAVNTCRVGPDPVTTAARPTARIDRHPARVTRTRRTRTRVVFTLAASDAAATLECRLGRATFKRCGRTVRLDVKRGRHRFQVRARNTAGAGPARTFTFRVVAPPRGQPTRARGTS